MASFQAWIEPLLWLCGVVATLAGFYKLISPTLKSISDTPKQLHQAITSITDSQTELKDRLDSMKQQLDDVLINIDRVEQIEIHLLHDAIMNIYSDAKRDGSISESSYRRALELYGMNGKDEYIKHIMNEIEEIHKKGE